MEDHDLSYYLRSGHSYCCENCDYRWRVGCNIEDEEVSLEYEDSFDYEEELACPICGSRNVSEI